MLMCYLYYSFFFLKFMVSIFNSISFDMIRQKSITLYNRRRSFKTGAYRIGIDE